ncbi:flagellar biosynthesis protein FlgI [Shimia sp.]|uniref:flagellar biosynthesis protein FlgI n=1 Tax=Shimia sp. TaxID=1954381 RepID=UPI003567E5A1
MAAIRKFRFGERREARAGASESSAIGITGEDRTNLEAYAETLQETIELLRSEIAAIHDGHLDIVSDLFERKSNLMKWLELKTPLIEPFLSHSSARENNIPQYLQELKSMVAEDSALLSRMSIAARSVVRELEKVNNRNALTGIYGKSGQKLGGPNEANLRIDREF